MKKRLICLILVLTLLIPLVSAFSFTNFLENLNLNSAITDFIHPNSVKFSPENTIDDFNLGEDQTTHSFVCSSTIGPSYCSHPTPPYDCSGDQRIRMACGTNASDDYIQFTGYILPNKVNYLVLQRPSHSDVYGNTRTNFEWFISGVSQGIVTDYGPSCDYLTLTIPARNTNYITLKFKNVPENSIYGYDPNGIVSCGTDFQYVHSYIASTANPPENPETCVLNSDCLDGYICVRAACVQSNEPPVVPPYQNQSNTTQPAQNQSNTTQPGNTSGNVTNITGNECTDDEYCQGQLGIGYGCVNGYCKEINKCGMDNPCSEGYSCDVKYCREIPGYTNVDVSNAIDDFNLGEDQTSHNFVCYQDPTYNEHDAEVDIRVCNKPIPFYDCAGDQRIETYGDEGLGCNFESGCVNRSNNYIEFTMGVEQNQKNILALRRPSGLSEKEMTLEWFINGKYQGVVQESGTPCELFMLNIPSQYTSTGQVTLKFKKCGYVHAYMFREDEVPNQVDINYDNLIYDNIFMNLQTEKDIYTIGEILTLR